MDRFLCSAASAERGELVLGTASRVDRWLLVESAGPWSQRALPRSRGLDDALVLKLQQRAKSSHARLLLVRKPGRIAIGAPREVFVADSRPEHLMLRRRTVMSDDELPDLPLPFDDPRGSDGWQPVDALVGVCTQGKHDTCCAVSGRPVIRALHDSHPQISYEISHIGGDRFAANLLVLPWGHYLGRVSPDAASSVIDDVVAGRRPSPYYRGRSVWTAPVQAAQEFAARELEEPSLSAFFPRSAVRVGQHAWRVNLTGPDGRDLAVDLEQRHGPERARLTCHAEHDNAVPSWALVSLVTADSAT